MKYSEVREMLLQHWTYTGGPNEAHSVEIYHDDALLELPQSHERGETLYFAEPFDAPEWPRALACRRPAELKRGSSHSHPRRKLSQSLVRLLPLMDWAESPRCTDFSSC
jgi:hypothetical protein